MKSSIEIGVHLKNLTAKRDRCWNYNRWADYVVHVDEIEDCQAELVNQLAHEFAAEEEAKAAAEKLEA